MSCRSLLVSLVCVTFLTSHACAQDTVLGKNREEWLKILKEHKEAKFRRAAVIALSVFGAKSAGVLPALMDALDKDSEPEIRREIALSFGIFGDDAKGTVDGLVDVLLKDKDGSVREAAARSLGRLAKHASSQVVNIGKAFKDPHPPVRAAIAEALTNFENVAVLRPQLLEVARNPKMDRFTRSYVVRLLANFEEQRGPIAEVFIGIVVDRDNHPALRKAAVDGLAQLGESAADTVDPLAKVAVDNMQDVELRRAAAVALGKIASTVPWPVIKGLLEDTDQNIRYQAVRLTGKFSKQEKDAIPALQKRLKDQSVEVIIAAIQELSEIGAVAVLPELERLARMDARKSVREAAEEALKKLKDAP